MTVVLRSGSGSATVDPAAGGRLTSLVVGRERLLQEPAFGDLPETLRYGCYLMAPFAGRVADGVVSWRGRTHRLATNGGRHAIHGTVYDAVWDVLAADPTSFELAVAFDPERWPYRGSLRQRYAIDAGGLDVEAEVLADEAMPVALGWHPWFLRTDDDVAVCVPGDTVLELGEGLLPTGRVLPVAGPRDLRDGPNVAGRTLDDVYPDVASPLVVRWPDLELRLEFGPTITTAVVFTGERRAVCVEPETGWPDAVRLSEAGIEGTGLVALEAGQGLVVTTRWSWTERAVGT